MRKIFSAALALVCVWFASPAHANCNLFDESTIQQGLHNENGVINNNISSWVASDMRIPVTASQTYTVMADATETGTTVVTNVVMFKDNEYVGYLPTAAVPFSFTPDSTYNQIELQFAYEPRKTINKSSITNVKLIENACIERCKNLFDAQIEKGGVQFTDGRLLSSPNRVRTGTFIEVTPNTTYTISTNMYNVGFFEYNSAGNYVSDSGTLRVAPVTFTTKENTTKVRFSFALQNTSADVNVNDVQWVQLEQGDTATEYVPYNAACHNNKITIATTKYNESAFSPLNTALANAISVVDSVVSNTITQAASIATLQAQKQTRPDESCPAGKKCLLVEDASGVPHWYEIVERYSRLPDGYTELQYIESTGTQYIDTGIFGTDGSSFEIRLSYSSLTGTFQMNGWSSDAQIGIDSGAYWWNMARGRTTVTLDTIYNTKLVISGNISELYVDGNLEKTSTLGDTHIAKGFGLFATVTGNYRSKEKVYNFVAKDSADRIVMNLVPAKNPDGKIGMYDLANGAFFENAGTGEFIAGAPVVE
ncbi:MAG: hypothetical protein IJU89_01655 [Alphaproteobacteria bacterium]|nr:hypothetical protein [Alphaproteobacteria bacterium]